MLNLNRYIHTGHYYHVYIFIFQSHSCMLIIIIFVQCSYVMTSYIYILIFYFFLEHYDYDFTYVCTKPNIANNDGDLKTFVIQIDKTNNNVRTSYNEILLTKLVL